MQFGDEVVLVSRRQPTQYVYAVRYGRWIKIGTTIDLPARLRALPGGVRLPEGWHEADGHDVQPLCAVPGDGETERLVHALLHPSRAADTEWFTDEPIVRAALASVCSDEARARLFGLRGHDLPRQGYEPAPVDF